MPRVVAPEPESIAADERADYDVVAERNATRRQTFTTGPRRDYTSSNYFGALMLSPKLGHIISDLGEFFQYLPTSERASYPPSDRHWVNLVVARELGSNMMFSQHLRWSAERGVRMAGLRALHAGRDEELRKDELELRRYTRAILQAEVTDEIFEGIKGRYGERGAVEFIAFVSTLLMTHRIMQAFDVPSPTDEELQALIDQLPTDEPEPTTTGLRN